MPMVPTPISQLTPATLPLAGTELTVVVQNGQTKRATVAAASGKSTLGLEVTVVLTAGNNNNVPVASTTGRILCDTAAGDAIITGFVAGFDGQLVLVTNKGPNQLTGSIENALSIPANELYGPFDLSYLTKDSFLMCYSASLARWVIL